MPTTVETPAQRKARWEELCSEEFLRRLRQADEEIDRRSRDRRLPAPRPTPAPAGWDPADCL